MTQRTVLTAVFVFIIVIGLLPILTMFAGSFVADGFALMLLPYRIVMKSLWLRRAWIR